MHPAALLKGMSLRSVSTGLEHACARARAAGVGELPAIQLGRQVFSGSEAIERAGVAMGALR
jgi:hypothetical protein